MKQGNVKAALKLPDNSNNVGVLSQESVIQLQSNEQTTVCEQLVSKHLPGQPTNPETLFSPPPSLLEPHPVLFERLDGEMICYAAPRTEGSAGSSGVDAYAWRRMCTSFKRASSELCNSGAIVAR